ncbi:acetate--CoA ligase family protein [Variovorax sp. GT1P44]|uniref:acetate--CoA ligase family protein n=1 Tax=Variovorax sp. GT1P44 TaxID=3443742 RepID=UPI003F4788C5
MNSYRDVTALVKPATVAVVGASARRSSQGNVVIQNLQGWGYKGRILPVHPSATEIDGLPAINAIADLPPATDTAVVAVPAADVLDTLRQLEAAGTRSAIVFANGFSAADEAAMRAFGETSRLAVHGPNCMGLVNYTDSVPLYPSRPSLRLKAGKVAIVAQSGSAAIAVMNSTTVGFSKIVTVGSEFQLATADYLHWLAGDDATQVVGVVAESIKDPVAFALAAESLHAAGKALVVLKVGTSEMGSAATQAHTGALVSSRDASDCFFSAADIATVDDYDELIASLECASVARRMVRHGRIAIAGISGGQTALACDVAAGRNVPLAVFSDATRARVIEALPGTPGHNPVDIGATVLAESRKTPDALRAILADPEVGALALLQDAQASLNPKTLENYMNHIGGYAAQGRASAKPVVMISPTSEATHDQIAEALAGSGVPIIRGLQEGFVAMRNLGKGHAGHAARWAEAHRRGRPLRNPAAAELRRELEASKGSLAPEVCFRILRNYDLPVVRSTVVKDRDEALRRAAEIGFPMVVKVASPQITHRSDVGGVVLGVRDADGLATAIANIARNVGAAAPHATIDGYELQEQITGDAEAVVGFADSAPFGTLMVVGTGGTQVELMDDRAVALAPVSGDEAKAMILQTRLGKLLDGYRNLMPKTDLGPLSNLLRNLSDLAMDLGDLIGACDLNPVLVKKGSGEIRVVDALMIMRNADAAPR